MIRAIVAISPLNYFSDSRRNLWLDSSGYLHLALEEGDGRFGDPQREAGQFALQPFDAEEYRHLFAIALDGTHTSHAFSWRQNEIRFVSIHGHADDLLSVAVESPERVIASWEYCGRDVPTPASERVHVKLWLYEGAAPSRAHEVVIPGFQFVAE